VIAFSHANPNKTVPLSRNKRRYSLEKQEAITGWLFVLPILAGFSIFTFFAILYSFGISLTRWDLLTSPAYIGFRNYFNVFKDPDFWQCMYNTVYFAAALIPLVLVLSLSVAIAINQKGIRFATYFKVSFYMPFVTSTIAIGMVWMWIFNPDTGLLNTILNSIGIDNPPRWFESVVWAKPAIVIMRCWQMTGYYMIMYLAGLQTIPDNLYEAAEIDGASKWQKTRHITIPLLSNTTFFVLIMLIIDAFNVFEAVYIMTQGGPSGSTNTMLYYIYDQAFSLYRMGYSSALSWVLFLIVFILTLIQFKVRKKAAEE